MGINNLNKFLRNNCEDIFEEIHISEYSFKKVAIDISLFLCKFKSVCGDKWISAFLNLVTCLRKNEVHCVFIYDSGAPQEKQNERKERSEQRKKTEERIYKLEEALEKFHLTCEIDPILIELYKKKNKNVSQKRLLNNNNQKDQINMKFIEAEIKRMKNYILNITSEDFTLTKKLFDILNIPYYDAPLEAETTCADLCKRGLVDAVLSEDTDVLAYGSPIFLSKIKTSNGTCVRINYEKMIKSLNMSKQQFLDLCIMCGTDYNKNIFRVGPEKAYKYLLEHKSIENLKENLNLDISILNHIRVRELFTNYKQANIKIKFCGTPDFKLLQDFVLKNNITFSIESLKKAFTYTATIVFEQDDEDISQISENENFSIEIEK